MNEDRYKQIFKQRIDEVLHYIWDPIGVSDTPEARDEYSTYADSVCRDALEGKSQLDISSYLTKITSEQMELDPKPEHDNEVAQIILDWAAVLKAKF